MAISKKLMNELNKNGYFNVNGGNVSRFKDAQATWTAQNIGMPAGILSQINTQVVTNMLNKRTADEVLGKREKLLDWAKEDYYTPIIERTGQTTPYSDNVMPVYAGMNINFDRVGHYRFTCAYRYENLKSEQISEAKINYNDMLLSAVTEAMLVELNRTAFEGYLQNSGNSFLCFGLLNNPQLNNYENAPQTFEAATWQQIMAFFASAVNKLVTQTGNNVNGQSKIRVAISSVAFTILQSKYTDLGISVYEQILKTYPNMEFIPAIELVKANNNQDVIYFIGESMAGGIAETTKLGYSELALMSNTELSYFSYSQAMAAGTIGALVFKPSMVVRYTNI